MRLNYFLFTTLINIINFSYIKMNTEFFIATRIVKSERNDGGFSKPIVRIAVWGIAVGLAVMIITVSVVTGFQNEIREKVIGFGSHISLTSYDNNESDELLPINKNEDFVQLLKNHSGITHLQAFARKAAIIKHQGEIYGVVVKGVGADFNWNFFERSLIEGAPLSVSGTSANKNVIVSSFIANRLKLKLNDSIKLFFLQNNRQAVRKLNICGIYKTDMGGQFDEVFVLADIAHLQKLNGWGADSVAGFELQAANFESIDALTAEINAIAGFDYLATNVKEKNTQVFAWLDAQNINAIIIITLMILVACVNMITALLILILERTNMIGIIKSLGMNDTGIRKIFLYNAATLIGRGLFWGNVLGIGLCFLQKQFQLLKLDAESYFLSAVPINFSLTYFLLLNISAGLICLLALIVPSYIVTKISPIKAIRFN
jgi:lipoprotein-releasing system permease protein